MRISGMTWHGASIEDEGILRDLPPALVNVLRDANGFILHGGALHVRGACLTPDWHSLRLAWRGPGAFRTLYDGLRATDIPFAQDQLGDQFLIRGAAVLRLSAETGDIEPLVDSLEEFFSHVNEDVEDFLKVGLRHAIQPGQLLFAYPPFAFRESEEGATLNPVPAGELISFHAELARKVRELPDGGQIEVKIAD